MTPALDIGWDSLSPDKAPSCLVAAHPHTNPPLLSGVGSSAAALTQTNQQAPLSWPRTPLPNSGEGSLEPNVASYLGDALWRSLCGS